MEENSVMPSHLQDCGEVWLATTEQTSIPHCCPWHAVLELTVAKCFPTAKFFQPNNLT